MQLRLGGDIMSLEHALDQIDTSTRAVEFVTEQLIRRAGRGAEATVHTLAQDGVSFLAGGRVLDEIGKCGLHR